MWTIPKKKIMLFATIYTICIIFFYKFYENVLVFFYKPENCSIQNMNLYDFEKHCTHAVNNYFVNFFKENSSTESKIFHGWKLMAPNMYAYSAFFDKCPAILHIKHCIKFVGIVLQNVSSVSPFISSMTCAVKYKDSIHKNATTIELLPESHDKMFTAAFLFCPAVSSEIPSHASFYHNSRTLKWISVEHSTVINEKATNLNLLQTGMASKIPNKLGLCVRPLYKHLDFLQFSEFVSYYSVMGVDHFIFYYTNSFSQLQLLTNFMKFSNLSFDIMYWNISLNNDLIHEYGQIVFTQDCLMRTKYKFKHAIIVDLDEYLVPQSHKDIKDMLQYLDSKNPLAGSYTIPMVLFCEEYFNENKYIYPFHVLNHQMRQKTVWLHHYRSKYILIPDRVKYGGVHFVWEFEDNYHEVNIASKIALINHYRSCCGLGQSWFFHLFQFNVLNDDTVIDNSIHSYLSKILSHPILQFIYNINCSPSVTSLKLLI